MAHYYFHLRDARGAVPDEEGRAFADLEAACAAALKDARAIIAEDVRSGAIDLSGRIEVADDAGRIVATVAFSEAVQVRRD